MTKDAVIDVVHKTMYGFFDVVADDSEEPMNEKDELLLEVNKAVCNAVKDMPDDECKKGRWIICGWAVKCSECNYDMPYTVRNYCPKCGAEMEGAE